MKGWLLLRWAANTAKLRGHTIRKTPSEVSYDLILEDGRWFRFPDDPTEQETFAIAIDLGSKEDRLALARKVEDEEFLQIEPGQFPNTTKGRFEFFKLKWFGEVSVLEDKEEVISMKLGKKRIVLVRRLEVEGQWRSYPGTPPGAHFARTSATDVLLHPETEQRFRPGTDEEMEFVREGDTWTMLRVPIACPGIWNGVNVTEDLLKRLIRNFYALRHVLYVPLKLGHTDKFVENAKFEKTGEPALGWVKELYWDDRKKFLRADIVKVPNAVVECIKKGAFTGISIEIAPDFSGYEDTLVGVALLGADLPAMTSLPKLLALYSQEGRVVRIVFSKGGDTMDQGLETLRNVAPEAMRAFQMEPETTNLDSLIEMLREKGYPTVLAKELLELLPEPTEEKISLMPNYDRSLWTARLETLAKRAELPEKCEAVIQELEEFLEMHGGELNEEEKQKVDDILAKARANLPHIEVEETKEAYPSYPTKDQAKVNLEQPTKGSAEQYPEAGPNVEIKEGKKSFSDEAEQEQEVTLPNQEVAVPNGVVRDELSEKVAALEEELKRKSLEAIEAKLKYFQASGVPEELLPKVREVLVELDPRLTPEPDRSKLQELFMSFVYARPKTSTFQRLFQPTPEPEVKLSEIILAHSRKARRHE